MLPCCTQLLRHGGLGGGGAGFGSGGVGSGDGEADLAASGSSGSRGSGETPAPPAATDLCELPARMQRFLDYSSRLSSLLSSFQACSWLQLLAFGRREEVRELTSALAWRLEWQVGQLWDAVEKEGSKVTGPARAAPGSAAAWHAQVAGEVLLFAADRLGEMLWLRRQGAGGGGEGDSARHAAASEAGTSEASTSGVGSAAKGEASCGKGEGEPGSGGGAHTFTCSEQHLTEEETDASPGGGAGSGGGDTGSDGGGASGALDGAGPAASVEAAGSSSTVDYGRAAAELWAEVSQLLPVAARGVLACAEVLLVTASAEGGGGASVGGEGGGAGNGVGALGDGSGEGAAIAAVDQQEGQLARATWYCCISVLECASLLLLAHVGAEAAGAGGAPSPWRRVLLGEVQLAGLLGAGVRLWGLVGGGEDEQVKKAKDLHLQLMEMAAVAFPAEVRTVVQGEGGAAGGAADGSEGPPAKGSSLPCPAPWCRVSLRAVRDALGGGGGGAGLEAVCRVAEGWEPEPGERRALLQQGARRLAAALWEEDEGSTSSM